MGGYIGATAVGLTTTAADVQGDITSTDTTPELILKNTTETDADGGRDGKITFKGEQSGGEESTLAQIQSSHDGTADDQAADLIFKTNDGSDNNTPTERLRIDKNGSILTATLGTDNVHLGEGAGAAIASGGNQNVVIGKDAGTALTTGDSNTFIGAKVGDAITTSSGNVAIGGDATYAALGSDTQGKFTTAIGVGALRAQNFTSDTQTNNTAIGYFAGGVMTTGTANTFVGSLAGDDCVDGIQNVAVGYAALSADAGNNNTAVGESALTSTTGTSNAAFGNGAGNAITTGNKNTVVGSYNGNQAGLDIRTSDNNIVLSDGDGNPRVWVKGGYFKASSNNSFDQASQTRHEINQNANGEDSFVIANSANSTPFGLWIRYTGAAPNNTGNYFLLCADSSANRFYIYSNGNVVNTNNSYGAISDIKLKENIVDSGSQWDDIKALTVRKYSMKSDNLDAPNKLGVIAQEVEAAGMGGLVFESADIDPDTKEDLGTVTKQVNYSILYMKAVKALQEAMTRIETLETQNTTQAKQIADLITRVEALEGA